MYIRVRGQVLTTYPQWILRSNKNSLKPKRRILLVPFRNNKATKEDAMRCTLVRKIVPIRLMIRPVRHVMPCHVIAIMVLRIYNTCTCLRYRTSIHNKRKCIRKQCNSFFSKHVQIHRTDFIACCLALFGPQNTPYQASRIASHRIDLRDFLGPILIGTVRSALTW